MSRTKIVVVLALVLFVLTVPLLPVGADTDENNLNLANSLYLRVAFDYYYNEYDVEVWRETNGLPGLQLHHHCTPSGGHPYPDCAQGETLVDPDTPVL